MRNRAWWVVAIWLVAATPAAAAEVVKDDWNWPAAMAAVAKKHTGEPGKVVPIGDSITYANPAGRPCSFASDTRPAL